MRVDARGTADIGLTDQASESCHLRIGQAERVAAPTMATSEPAAAEAARSSLLTTQRFYPSGNLRNVSLRVLPAMEDAVSTYGGRRG
jgi:hypothetical protein